MTLGEMFKGSNRELAANVISLIYELRKYWPLTVRQVYYQCVARLYVPNNHGQYQKLSKMLTRLRRENLIGWDAIEDRTRRTVDKRGIDDMRTFVQDQMEEFLNWRYYHRCRVQNQEVYLEVASEKDALASILEGVVWPYCCRLNIVRGQVSATMVERMAERFCKAKDRGQTPVLLYFGDLDPSGVQIPLSLQKNLIEHHRVEVHVDRCALNPRQIKQYSLPESFDAAKKSDPNYERWIGKYGNTPPTELDALHPETLTTVAKAGIENWLDMEDFKDQMEIEELERDRLKSMQYEVSQFIQSQWPEFFTGIQSGY